jgi:hypothetical protein
MTGKLMSQFGCLLVILLIGGCLQKEPVVESQVQFKVDTTEWMEADPEKFALTDHYGIVVVDTSEMKKIYEDLNVAQSDPIDFPLTEDHQYYILFIAYDASGTVLNFIEKEFEI